MLPRTQTLNPTPYIGMEAGGQVSLDGGFAVGFRPRYRITATLYTLDLLDCLRATARFLCVHSPYNPQPLTLFWLLGFRSS